LPAAMPFRMKDGAIFGGFYPNRPISSCRSCENAGWSILNVRLSGLFWFGTTVDAGFWRKADLRPFDESEKCLQAATRISQTP
jgi:hypothetical protein